MVVNDASPREPRWTKVNSSSNQTRQCVRNPGLDSTMFMATSTRNIYGYMCFQHLSSFPETWQFDGIFHLASLYPLPETNSWVMSFRPDRPDLRELSAPRLARGSLEDHRMLRGESLRLGMIVCLVAWGRTCGRNDRTVWCAKRIRKFTEGDISLGSSWKIPFCNLIYVKWMKMVSIWYKRDTIYVE